MRGESEGNEENMARGHFSKYTVFIFSQLCLTFKVAFLEVGSGFWLQSGCRQSRDGGQRSA